MESEHDDMPAAFRLLDLSPELRIIIYKAHLASLRFAYPFQLGHATRGIFLSSRLIALEYHAILIHEIRIRHMELEKAISVIKSNRLSLESNLPQTSGLPYLRELRFTEWSMTERLQSLASQANWSDEAFANVFSG